MVFVAGDFYQKKQHLVKEATLENVILAINWLITYLQISANYVQDF